MPCSCLIYTRISMQIAIKNEEQLLSSRLLHLRLRGHFFKTQRRHCVMPLRASHFILYLVLIQPRKTKKHPDMTEKLLTGI